jgi:hypothetical protein
MPRFCGRSCCADRDLGVGGHPEGGEQGRGYGWELILWVRAGNV